MYGFLIGVHNVLAWGVLLTGAFVLVRAATGRERWSDADTAWVRRLTLLVHTQLLAGVALWVTSPSVAQARGAMAATMKDPVARRLVVEHPATMVLAVVVATLTGVLVRRAPDARAKAGRALTGTAVTMLLVAALVPWSRLIGTWTD